MSNDEINVMKKIECPKRFGSFVTEIKEYIYIEEDSLNIEKAFVAYQKYVLDCFGGNEKAYKNYLANVVNGQHIKMEIIVYEGKSDLVAFEDKNEDDDEYRYACPACGETLEEDDDEKCYNCGQKFEGEKFYNKSAREYMNDAGNRESETEKNDNLPEEKIENDKAKIEDELEKIEYEI